MRIARNREAVLRLRVDDEGGILTSADDPPTYEVVDSLAAVVASGTAAEESSGIYAATLAARPDPEILTLRWELEVGGQARVVEEPLMVVQDRIAPLWRFRQEETLASMRTEDFLLLIGIVEDWLSSALKWPVCEEPFVETVRPGRARNELLLPFVPFPTRIDAITQDGVAVTDTISIGDGGVLLRDAGWNDAVYTVTGLHRGPWGATPEDLIRAAVVLARYAARASNYPERARQIATEGAVITFTTPSPDRPTGLPEVDLAVSRYGRRVVV